MSALWPNQCPILDKESYPFWLILGPQNLRNLQISVKMDFLVPSIKLIQELKIQSCDWSTRFMKVILLRLSLVSTNVQVLQYRCTFTGLQYKHTAVQLIQAQCVHHKCVQLVLSCTAGQSICISCVQQYNISVHESIYIKLYVRVCVRSVYLSCVHRSTVYLYKRFTLVKYI